MWILELKGLKGAELPLRGGKCSKMYLKINRSMKTPWHRPRGGVARSLFCDGF